MGADIEKYYRGYSGVTRSLDYGSCSFVAVYACTQK